MIFSYSHESYFARDSVVNILLISRACKIKSWRHVKENQRTLMKISKSKVISYKS